MLSMQPSTAKANIIAEAARLLRPGGRYGIHELCLVPDDLDESIRAAIQHEMSGDIHVGVRPLTGKEWCELLDGGGTDSYCETHCADASFGTSTAGARRRISTGDAIYLERCKESRCPASGSTPCEERFVNTVSMSLRLHWCAPNPRRIILSDAYTFADLADEIEPPTDGTLSRTVFNDERLKVILFGFSAGQELSEHTASSPAIMHF